ncbi:pentapeptide repeat-containing protein [Nonomuraea sp. NPDC049141]|uniref:pentapeptide repeat-containing protein n=1 Tax=Nonomuraea sp. NPDC049141 TaxID=3155500 RepID=UPI0033D98961
MIAISAGAALSLNIPDWGRWTLAGTAVAGISALGIAVLIGPAANRLAGERHPLTQVERQQMTATERVEAVNAARHTLIQAATGLVVIGGVVFTGQGLWYTAQSLDASRQAQRTAEQGQIADRYTKAVEQIGSGTLDVRLGGMYALERLAQDSPRDHQTVYDVLAAFIREHDPKPTIKAAKLSAQPATDVQAALTIIGRRNTRLDAHMPDLSNIRAPGANLTRATLTDTNLSDATLTDTNLTGANLTGADLFRADVRDANLSDANLFSADVRGANLSDAYLTGAYLSDANLTGATLTDTNLTGANLTGADLFRADLRGATLTYANVRGAKLTYADLTGAKLTDTNLRGADLTDTNLSDATLSGADLTGADLSGATLTGAYLSGANLTGATLTGATLTGANLTGISGMTQKAIRAVAIVDDKTKF